MEQTLSTPANPVRGWINGFICVVIFSGSLPATKIAINGFSPDFLTVGRATITGLIALLILGLLRQKLPTKAHLIPLAIVAVGGVIGFPLLTSLALRYVSSAHSIVFTGLLPLVTAFFAVIRARERPRKLFWMFSVLGSLFVIGFALFQGGQSTLLGDTYMIAAILLCGLGYAEGAVLSKQLGSWQVICWALVISFPIMLVLGIVLWPDNLTTIPTSAWARLLYVSLFSMLIVFFFWYRGLTEGRIASVGQLQLLQPFIGLLLSAWLLNEAVSGLMIASTCGVLLCVAASKKYAK